MLGFAPISSRPIAAVISSAVPLSVAGLIVPEQRLIVPERAVSEGVLVKSVSNVWAEIVRELGADWSLAYKLPWEKWEELVAGAYKKAGFDEVILTPKSGDHGT